MQDLSKIDFSKCKLPEWSRWALEASDGPEPNAVSVSIRNGMRLAKRLFGGEWFQYASGTFDELRELEAICRQVDAFIESELAKQSDPEWRPCSKEFALDHASDSQWQCEAAMEEWSQIDSYQDYCSQCEFRTKAPLQQHPDPLDARNPGRTYSARGYTDSEREWFESVIRDTQTAPGDVTRVFYAVSKLPKADGGAK